MKKISIILSILLFTSTACSAPRKKKRYICSTKTAVVAVIDTGFSFSNKTKGVKLCKYGHKDFSGENNLDSRYTKTPVPKDNHGHGTNVVGLIQKHAGDSNFCMVIIKYYNPKNTNQQSADKSVKSIQYAIDIKADYINYSGGGQVFDHREHQAIKKFLDRGGKVIAAAGNEKSNIDYVPFYPAMSDHRVISVGSTDEIGIRLPSSNYGSKVTTWEVGYKQEAFGISSTGTSQAAAITTGKIINKDCAK